METIVQVVTMKTLVPALLAVLLLAGCAVNKPLPVEPVKLAGMEFYPTNDSQGFKCNTYSSTYKINTLCLAHENFTAWRFYDGEMTLKANRSQFIKIIQNSYRESAGESPIETGNPNLLINKLKSGEYLVTKFDDETGYVSIVRYYGNKYKQALPVIDQILADLKNYSPRLGGKQ